jgi:hypothetical protein
MDNSTNENGFQFERPANGMNDWIPLVAVSANVTSYSDTDLPMLPHYLIG